MNMNFDVLYEDMVRGARSGSSSGRRLSSGRGSSTASFSGPSVPPPTASVIFWSFCASSSGSRIESSNASYVSYPYDRLGSVYASSSYGRRIECVHTSSFFGRRTYDARGRGCCQSTGGGR
ncbi:hypothetical protein Taro_046748 [Colocasia esculenta]|uniref:Uncharacterized protein n=1 Tax=Colocasia esculenta TaxID=4460 RepID=A0A843X6I3_COLES|nr:hypothetical protein [Colocasia esculenta]